jgi:hypothetical protein
MRHDNLLLTESKKTKTKFSSFGQIRMKRPIEPQQAGPRCIQARAFTPTHKKERVSVSVGRTVFRMTDWLQPSRVASSLLSSEL